MTTEQPARDESLLRVLFPQYWRMDSMVRGEVEGVAERALDWTSGRYGWAGWSMRQQTSHMASLVSRWLLVRWGGQLFPAGLPVSADELEQLNSPDHDRRLSDVRFFRTGDILREVDRAVELARSVLQQRTVAEGRAMKVTRSATGQWALMSKAHPHGVTADADGGGTMTLEATFRHMYFEYMTHLFNIQRIKRALGLPVIVRLPEDGYHTLPGWDVSEAAPGSEKF